MKEVKSSNIAKIGHDGKTLTIEFKGSGTYDYADVPAELHDKMMAAHDVGESVGKFFHAHIRNKFTGVKREEQK